MSTPNLNSNRRPLLFPRFQRETASRMPSAQEVLWREWRNCDDADYARYLFDLLIDQPLDNLAFVISGLVGVSLGAIGGLLITFLGWGSAEIPGLSAGVVIGLVVAMMTGLALRLGGRNRWGIGLQGFVPSKPVISRPGGLNFTTIYVTLILGLGCGMGIRTIEASPSLPFNQLYPVVYDFGPWICILLVVPLWYLLRNESASLLDWVAGIIVGAIFGWFFGLLFVQVLGSQAGSLDMLNSARVAGLAVGFVFGWYWGRGTGFIGLLIIQLALTGLVLATSSDNAALLGWLLGLLAGGVLGSYSLMWRPADRLLNFEGAYAYRRAFLWWASRPLAAEVEAALAAQAGQEELLQQLREQVVSTAVARSAVSRKAVLPGQFRRRRGWWAAVRRYLASLIKSTPASPEEAQTADEPRQPARTVEDLVKDLQAATWQERFMARHALLALGGEVVPRLLDFTNINKGYDLGDWLIRSIAYETGRRLAAERQMWICPACLTACGGHIAIDNYGLPVTYYGCRTCGQSRHLLYCPQGVVAVLDADWTEAYSYQDNQLRANWLVCQTLFDFDTVEIVHASDEDVERLAMNVGNDTDPVRKARYSHVRCVVAPECRLSENSLRVLEQVFGQVEVAATLAH